MVYYQSQFDASNIAGANSAALVISPVTVAEAGTYSLTVSNAFGSTNSSNATLTVNMPTCDSAQAELLSLWQGEGNALDSFGTNNGILVGGVSFTEALRWARAFSFDGASGYVTNPVSCLNNVNDTYTLEFWAWPTGERASTAESTNSVYGIADQRYAIFPVNDELVRITRARACLSVPMASAYLNRRRVTCRRCWSYNAAISGWTHVAVVYSNRQPTLYVNGVAVQTGLTSTHTLRVRRRCWAESGYNYGYYAGLLDEGVNSL